MPRVAVHNDLTMWNVLVDRDGSIAIVDWEGAESAALPLADFFYAATDAAAAVRRYADRLDGLVACFTTGGRHAIMVGEMQARLCGALGMTARQAELCFHACWLRHAVDERRLGRESDRAPFLEIVEWAARRREVER